MSPNISYNLELFPSEIIWKNHRRAASKNMLGIWPLRNQRDTGSHGLVMSTRDIAKTGYLFLQGGYWDGKQILPETWVNESTKQQSKITWKGYIADYYGYGWYPQPFGFHSLGYQGQYIFVIPDLEIVVVFTAELALHELELPIEWVRKYIIAAAKTAEPLSESKETKPNLSAEITLFNNTPFW